MGYWTSTGIEPTDYDDDDDDYVQQFGQIGLYLEVHAQ